MTVYGVAGSMSTATDAVELVGDEATKNVARAVLFAAVTSATAPMSFTHPLAPNVPITMQTVWVYLSGLILGPIWAGLAFVLYVVAGLIGLPVFEGGGGLGYVLGPTGGYIFGFVGGAVVVGLVAHGTGDLRKPAEIPLVRVAAALVAGTAVVYALGAVGLVFVQNLSFVRAVAVGIVPFIPVAAVKMAGVMAIVRSETIVAR
jgi:biotin transport system substrate-specific component